MTPDPTTIATAILAGGLSGAAVTAWSTARGERLADRRVLRDRRAERLREAFRPLIRAATECADLVHRQAFLLEGETVATRDEVLYERYRRAMTGVEDAQIALLLEPRASGIAELFRATGRAYRDHQICRELNEKTMMQGAASGAAIFDLGEKSAALDTAVDRLGDEMIRALAELEKALPLQLWQRACDRFPWLRRRVQAKDES